MRTVLLIAVCGVLGSCAGAGPQPATVPEPGDVVAAPLPPTERTVPSSVSPVRNEPADATEPDGFAPGPARMVGTSRGYAHVAVIPLAPDHVGRTVSSQPALYWYLSAPVTVPIVFVLIDTRTVQVAHDVTLTPPFRAGLQVIPLKELGITLEPNVPYRWYLDVVIDDQSPSRDIVSGGMIERVQADAAVPDPAGAANAEMVAMYARAGLWYDAIAAVSKLIAAAPDDQTLRRQRASLLRQIGLHEVADRDLE